VLEQGSTHTGLQCAQVLLTGLPTQLDELSRNVTLLAASSCGQAVVNGESLLVPKP
jgi:hypothetical protein